MHDTHRPGTCKSTLATLQRRLTPQTHPHSGIAPCLILASVNAYNLWNEHWEHWSHMPPLEERVEYPYQNIRTKNFPWGDGDKTIFWNDSVNYHNKDKTTESEPALTPRPGPPGLASEPKGEGKALL